MTFNKSLKVSLAELTNANKSDKFCRLLLDLVIGEEAF